MSVGHLCRLFGVSRQAFYQRQHYTQRVRGHSMLALRREIPGLGTRKLYLLLQEPLAVSGIKMGRDKLCQLPSLLRQLSAEVGARKAPLTDASLFSSLNLHYALEKHSLRTF